MKDKERQKYAQVMNEIKKRVKVVHSFLSNETNGIYRAPHIEIICLQIRKILELIALASLVVNQKIFLKKIQDLQKMWNAKMILKDIKRLNPDFYPKPIKEVPSSTAGVKSKLLDIQDGFLTEKEFETVYEKCGRILHASNPLGSRIDYSFYEYHIPIWMEKIKILLNSHKIKLLNDNNLYLVHMKEENGDSVQVYIFEKMR